MKNLTLVQDTDGTFTAVSSEALGEMHSLKGSIYQLWCKSRSLLEGEDLQLKKGLDLTVRLACLKGY